MRYWIEANTDLINATAKAMNRGIGEPEQVGFPSPILRFPDSPMRFSVAAGLVDKGRSTHITPEFEMPGRTLTKKVPTYLFTALSERGQTKPLYKPMSWDKAKAWYELTYEKRQIVYCF